MSAHGDKADAFALSEGGRLCPDASEQVAGRVKAFKNRGRGFFNRKNYDRAMANHGEARILKLVNPQSCRICLAAVSFGRSAPRLSRPRGQ
jgi:hypothetical protein